jgi:predicted metal-binding protein
MNTYQKAIQWIGTGSVGLSSKTMWNCLMGNTDYSIWCPCDPDDFSRCYELLQAVPEWKAELYKLKPLSKAWSNLVDNWDTLTKMYEQNLKENWKNYKKIKMFEFMQTLIS